MKKELADTVASYDASAENYDQSIGQLENYDSTYRYFCSSLPKKCAVLDLACGSGVISRKILAEKPAALITGVDLSGGMLALARNTVPGATFIQANICEWKSVGTFDGIVIGFGLPYLDDADCVKLIARSSKWLVSGGGLYISFMQGEGDGYEKVSFSPDMPLYIYYHDEAMITNAMVQAGIIPEKVWHLEYIESDGSTTIDVVVVGRKR